MEDAAGGSLPSQTVGALGRLTSESRTRQLEKMVPRRLAIALWMRPLTRSAEPFCADNCERKQYKPSREAAMLSNESDSDSNDNTYATRRTNTHFPPHTHHSLRSYTVQCRGTQAPRARPIYHPCSSTRHGAASAIHQTSRCLTTAHVPLGSSTLQSTAPAAWRRTTSGPVAAAPAG